MKTILTLTLNPCVDMNSHVEKILSEEKIRCTPAQYDPGGGGINVSRVIKILGGSSTALYCSGGSTGDFLEKLLERDSLEKKIIKIKGQTRQNITFCENQSNEQFRFVMPGPTLMESEWRKCLDFIFSLNSIPSYIVVSGTFPPGVPRVFISKLVKQLVNTEARLIVDTSGEMLHQAYKEESYLLKPNLKEFAALLNRKKIDDHELVSCCQEFVANGKCEILILSLGEKGAILATRNEVRRIIAPKVISKSKIGAGDSMVGGIVFGLANDFSLLDSALLGVAAGSAAVLSEGTKLCLADDVWEFYKKMKEGDR